MGAVIVVLAVVGVTIYSVVDCLRTPEGEMRGLPKPLWLLVILALVPAGALLWIFLGHEDGGFGRPGGRPARRVVAPDDDPDFLRSLDGPEPGPSGPPGRDGEDGEPA
jgi:hypothetical protein